MKKRITLALSCIMTILRMFIPLPSVATEESGPISITILYDNYSVRENFQAEFGFSCLIEGTEKTILFDTGRAKSVFFDNVNNLQLDIGGVEQIIISHNHSDHTGNIFNVLEINSDVEVYVPDSFPHTFVERIEDTSARVVRVKESIEINNNALLTGEMPNNRAEEQSLLLDTRKGLVIITGCSHSGITEIVEKAKALMNKEVYLVMGGFHLNDVPDEQVKLVIGQLKEMGVHKIGASHCTGDRARLLFKEEYRDNFEIMGVGSKIEL